MKACGINRCAGQYICEEKGINTKYTNDKVFVIQLGHATNAGDVDPIKAIITMAYAGKNTRIGIGNGGDGLCGFKNRRAIVVEADILVAEL